MSLTGGITSTAIISSSLPRYARRRSPLTANRRGLPRYTRGFGFSMLHLRALVATLFLFHSYLIPSRGVICSPPSGIDADVVRAIHRYSRLCAGAHYHYCTKGTSNYPTRNPLPFEVFYKPRYEKSNFITITIPIGYTMYISISILFIISVSVI